MGKHFDYLVVGAGLFGSAFSHEMTENGRTCLVIDQRACGGKYIYQPEEGNSCA